MSPSAPLLDVVLFDIDDTLYSTTGFAEAARRAAVEAMVAHGLAAGVEEACRELGEVVSEFSSNYDQHFDRLLDRLGPAAARGVNRAVLIAAGVVAYHRTKERDMAILPDARDLLVALRAARVRAGIVSAGLQIKQAEKLVRLGVLPYLDPRAIFFTDQMGVGKPNPKLWTKACEELGVPPPRAIYVGDRAAHDVAPARAAGLRTVLYLGSHGKHADEATPVSPDHAVADLRDLLPILASAYGLPVG